MKSAPGGGLPGHCIHAEKLGITDEDISAILTNMLENALQACERMRTG